MSPCFPTIIIDTTAEQISYLIEQDSERHALRKKNNSNILNFFEPTQLGSFSDQKEQRPRQGRFA